MATGASNDVAVIDTVANTILKFVPVGRRPWGIAVTPDGRKLYVANGVSDDVSVIDTATERAVATIPAGKGPWGVVIGP